MKFSKANKGFSLRAETGFSLPELMVTVVIIGILAGLALPRMRAFIARARQAEAKTMLSQIHQLQVSHQTLKDKYLAWPKGEIGYTAKGVNTCTLKATHKKLGFKPDGCQNMRYEYWVQVKDDANDSGIERFHAIAVGLSDSENRIYPTCDGSKTPSNEARDTVTIHHTDAVAKDDSALDYTVVAAGGDVWTITDDKILQSSDIVTVCSDESKTGENVWKPSAAEEEEEEEEEDE